MAEAQEPQTERTDTNPKDAASFWQVQLDLADKDQKDWERDAKSVVDRYKLDKRKGKGESRYFNILFSNTETLKSTLYGRTAKPDVRRRFADKDPAAREAAEVIERALIYAAESYDVDKCVEPAIHDYLLPGRGIVRVEYEPVIKERPKVDPYSAQPTAEMEEFIADQICRERYIYWSDYRQNPARTFDDVWWLGFRHIMTRQDLRDNKFEGAEAVPLNWSPDTDSKEPVSDDLKRAEVWEIWDKSQRKRIWIVKGYTKPLRIDDDPYGLEDFFPLPEPIRSVEDTETLVPRPEYFEYRDQAEDLDEIVGRISRLTKALKRRGVYNQAVKELKRLATAGDNQFIPVENWQALAMKGGLDGGFLTEDISQIAVVLKELYVQRDMLVQAIYELTGIADIMRGSSDPNETLGAQELKAQFGSTRIKRRQRAVQKWIRDLYKLKAEIIAEHFEPQVLQEMTGIQVTPEVMQILRSDKLRAYRIDIETDSTVFEDEASVKQQTSEALTAIGGFFREALPAVQSAPELAPLAFEMVGMAARNLKKGRELEDLIEQTKEAIMQKVQAAQQNQQPSPEQQKAEAEKAKMEMQAGIEQQKMAAQQQADASKMEMEREKMAAELQFKQAELDLKKQELALKLQETEAKMAMEREKAASDMQLAQMKAQQETELAKFKANSEAEIASREAEIRQRTMEEESVISQENMRTEGQIKAEQGRQKISIDHATASEQMAMARKAHEQQMKQAEAAAQHDQETRKAKSGPRKVKFIKGKDGIEGAEIH